MPQCNCGKELQDWRGARGHVQFNDDDTHGQMGEVPNDWKRLFDGDPPDYESDDGGDGSEQPNQDRTPSEGRIKRLLTTPVDELL